MWRLYCDRVVKSSHRVLFKLKKHPSVRHETV